MGGQLAVCCFVHKPRNKELKMHLKTRHKRKNTFEPRNKMLYNCL